MAFSQHHTSRTMPPKQQQQQPAAPGRHTIMLIQPTQDVTSRTYTDHNSVADAMRNLLTTFENSKLREKRAAGPLSYTSNEALAFLDSLHDISMLCFDGQLKAYVPYNRKFVKDKFYQMLARQQ